MLNSLSNLKSQFSVFYELLFGLKSSTLIYMPGMFLLCCFSSNAHSNQFLFWNNVKNYFSSLQAWPSCPGLLYNEQLCFWAIQDSLLLGHSRQLTAQKSPALGLPIKGENIFKWEIPPSFAMLSHHNILSAVGAAATGGGFRCVFQANYASCVGTCRGGVILFQVSENEAGSWLAVRWNW